MSQQGKQSTQGIANGRELTRVSIVHHQHKTLEMETANYSTVCNDTTSKTGVPTRLPATVTSKPSIGTRTSDGLTNEHSRAATVLIFLLYNYAGLSVT